MVQTLLARKSATANPHINLGILRESSIPVPLIHEQQAVVEVLESAEKMVEALTAEELALRHLRSTLIANLLSGEHNIPDSYDRFLE
jgi:restriction endonuclease S subunit